MSTTGPATPTMTNVDLIRSSYAAFAAGDVAAVLAVLADDITWRVPGRHPLSGVYTGPDEVLGFFGGLAGRSGGTFAITLDNVLDDRDGTVAALVTERGERGGMQLTTSAIHVWRILDGRATSFQGYQCDDHKSDAFWS